MLMEEREYRGRPRYLCWARGARKVGLAGAFIVRDPPLVYSLDAHFLETPPSAPTVPPSSCALMHSALPHQEHKGGSVAGHSQAAIPPSTDPPRGKDHLLPSSQRSPCSGQKLKSPFGSERGANHSRCHTKRGNQSPTKSHSPCGHDWPARWAPLLTEHNPVKSPSACGVFFIPSFMLLAPFHFEPEKVD
jgi:hypothetical protein